MKKRMYMIIAASLFIVGLAVGLMSYYKIVPLGLGMHKPVFQNNKVALNGYDVITYFKEPLAMGNPSYAATYNGTSWYFSSKNHLDEFKLNPDQYLPQFGGYCTKAVSTGFAAPADPSIYDVLDGKLYIFSSLEVREHFKQNPGKIITACEKRWK